MEIKNFTKFNFFYLKWFHIVRCQNLFNNNIKYNHAKFKILPRARPWLPGSYHDTQMTALNAKFKEVERAQIRKSKQFNHK